MRSLNVLADPTRQRIVEMLARGALSSGEIARRFDVSIRPRTAVTVGRRQAE